MNGLIQTTSAALFAAALSAPAPAQTLFRGLRHTSLDGAQLSIPQATGRLKISNLGSSGCDGVSIALPDTERVDIELIPLTASSYPGTAGFELEAFGEIAGVADQSTSRVEAGSTGQEWLLTPHFAPMGATSYTIEVHNGGALVHQQSGRADGTAAFECRAVDSYYMRKTIRPGTGETEFDWCFDTGFAGPIDVVGGPTVVGDMVTLRSDDGGATTSPLLSRLDMMGTDLSTIEVESESIYYLGNSHTAVEEPGDVEFSRGENGGIIKLKISNLGSSGCDGVSIAPPDETVEVVVQYAEPTFNGGPPQPGSYVFMECYGTVNGVDDTSCGSSRVTQTQTGYDITADFSALGANMLMVEVYDDGARVASIPCAVNPAMSAPASPKSMRAKCFTSYSWLPSYSWGWDTDVLLTISGAGTFTGDELVLIAENPTVRPEKFVRAVAGGNDVELNLTAELLGEVGVFEPYCDSGISANGCQALLSASGSASASAASGFVVTSSDVEGDKDGLFFYGQNGRQQNPWGNGTSFQCVVTPVQRGGLQSGTGTPGACDGGVSQDLNARWCPTCPKSSQNPTPGTPLQVQFWYRDPFNTSNQTTSLSHAIEVPVQP